MFGAESEHNEIAKRYGGVLFSLAQENKVLKDISKDVTRLQTCLLQEPLEWARITSPTTPLKIQRQLVEKLATSLKLGKLTTQFLKVVCHNHRLENLVFMLENFKIRCREGIEGVVETATELSQQKIEHLQSVLKQQLGKDVSLQQTLKENLLGGIVLRIGTLMIDASLKTTLNKLHHVMKG
ncbi:MAG: ATP synthase F1 subunit delta [Proteobacteria bacterium]|nr:ATP synthase F1 subunit delta [Pseudomonadota bacterium]